MANISALGIPAVLLLISFISLTSAQTQILPSILAAQLPEPGTCGPTKLSNRIYGGTDTSTDEFPWMALIEYTRGKDEKKFECGGSLISDRYVLTAAHCVAQLDQGSAATGVRLGEWDIKTDPDCEPDGSCCADRHVDVPIEKIISHPGFENINGQNDIALIRLSRSVNFTNFISPICLPLSDHLKRSTFDRYTMDISGWGLTKAESKQVYNIKQKAEVEVVPFSQCQSAVKQKDYDINSQMCSFGKSGIGTCVGDSGGPLFGLDASNKTLHYYFIAGIVSQGPPYCGSVGVPDFYTKVSNFTDWILENMHSLNQKDARLRAELPGPDECGHIISNPISDTNITRINEYPWMAMLFYINKDNKTEAACTGSLINQRYVLTSAHCIKGYEDNLITVRLGEWDTQTNPDCEKNSDGLEKCADQYISVPIEKAVPHEYFSFRRSTANKTPDIGLLRLSRRIEYTDFIRPICLPLKEHHRESTFDGHTMYISGWSLSSLNNSYSLSNVKLKNEVHVVPFRDCQRQLKEEPMLHDLQFSQMCVEMEKRLDSCVFNGALIGLNIYNSNKVYYFTAGIPSSGYGGCPGQVAPHVYTRVSAYVDWIQENIEP